MSPALGGKQGVGVGGGGATGGGRLRGGGGLRGGGRGSSSIRASPEEPQLVTQKFLFRSSRYTPRLASCRQARGPESGGGDRRPGRAARRPHPPQVPSPDPKQSPHSRSRIRYLPGAPGPSVTASPAGRALGGSRSPGRTKWSPPAGYIPLSRHVGGQEGGAGEVEAEVGARRTDKIF